jgi:hypothetical protein
MPTFFDGAMVQSSITVERLLLLCGGTKMGLLERAVTVDLYLSVKHNHSKQHRFPQNRRLKMAHDTLWIALLGFDSESSISPTPTR